MINIRDKSKCTGCGACSSICKNKCIDLEQDNEGFFYPTVNQSKCIGCNICDSVCPIINNRDVDQPLKVYAAYTKDLSLRKQSSSGGVFSVLAEYILSNNGVVFGAAFNSSLQVEHICVNRIEDLAKLRMSKYVQSNIGNTYQLAKDYLLSGIVVLFTGTPCQIAGLKMFLQKEYNNLYTQDIVCFGVPSPLHWKKHKEYIISSNNIDLYDVEFRNKSDGWKNYSVKYSGHNNSLLVNHGRDDYLKAFFSKICLRPSCYECAFKGKRRASDITLGDFWGIEEILPDMYDEWGTSLVLCNTDKGFYLFSKILNSITYKEVAFQQVIKHNPMVMASTKITDIRESFFISLRNRSYKRTINRFFSQDKVKNALLNDYYSIKKEKGTVLAALWLTKKFIMIKKYK